MADDIAATDHRDRIIDLASDPLETSTAAMPINYQAMLGLISRVASPSNHVDQAIELITERREEAETIACREFEQLTEAEQEQFTLGVGRHVTYSMVIAADMLARTGNLMWVPDVYDLPPDVIAAAAAMLVTSGLINNAKELFDGAGS